MKQKTVIAKVFALAVICLAALFVINIQMGSASKTLIVPDNYPTISAAVGNASQGDTVQVRSGVYYENVIINKSVSVIGEDSKNTIVIGTGGVERGARAVFTLATDGVKLSGFTIESLNYSSSNYYATGIIVEGDGCSIIGNSIRNTYIGIFCSVQSATIIAQNTISASLKDGIRFFGGSLNKISENNIVGNSVSGIAIEGYSNTISRNNITNNLRAIGLGSSNSVVFGNRLISNIESGIFLADSKNIISANDIKENKWGIFFSPQLAAPNENKLYHNNFDNANNVYASTSSNVQIWDDDYPSGGNYWSDYTSTNPTAKPVDSSGIGDLPYVISVNNTDRYPLTAPFNISKTDTPPSADSPATPTPNSIVASWSFEEVEPNGVTPDATGNNPANLGLAQGNISYTPNQVEGKFGKALNFDGRTYVSVPVSPSLEIAGEITIEAWINVQSFKKVTYNNIIVECIRTTAPLPTRVVGLAVKGDTAENSSSTPQGALLGYVFTETEGLNEIATTEPAITLNQWTHVVFTRSLATGMHIYVNGEEKTVTVTSGALNPAGSIERENEIYVGHDSVSLIDEVRISNMATDPTAQPFWTQWWLWATLAVGAAAGVFVYFKKRAR